MTQNLNLPVYLDATMINSFRSCRRKFYYSFLHNLQPQGKSIHLVAGASFAAGVDAARKYFYTTSIPEHSAMLETAMAAFIKEWGDFEAPEGHAKSFHNTFHALEQYFLNYHPAVDPVQPLIKQNGEPTIEFSFAIPLPIFHPSGDPFIYCGRFDLLGRWNDLLTIMDEKTTSALGASWLKQWEMRGQFLGYCWACQQLGYPVRQVVVRGVGILKTEIKFLSALQQYPQYLIDRWYSELLQTVHEIKNCFEAQNYTYAFGDACSSYGGCAYTSLCIADNEEDWFSNYDKRVWNPLLRGEVQTD